MSLKIFKNQIEVKNLIDHIIYIQNMKNSKQSFPDLEFQIEKIVLFLLEQQGVLAHRLSDIGKEHHTLIQQPNSSNISELQEAYRDVGRDLLRLLNFMEMNAIGLRKILKKIDKRFGHKFSDYYVKTRANHPYSQLRQVFKHVVMFLSLNTTFFKFYFKLFESALPSCLMLQNVRWYDVVGSLFFIFCTLFV